MDRIFPWWGAAPDRCDDDGNPVRPSAPAPAVAPSIAINVTKLQFYSEVVLAKCRGPTRIRLPLSDDLRRAPLTTCIIGVEIDWAECVQAAPGTVLRLAMDEPLLRTTWSSDSDVPHTFTFPAAPFSARIKCAINKTMVPDTAQTTRRMLHMLVTGAATSDAASPALAAVRQRFVFGHQLTGTVTPSTDDEFSARITFVVYANEISLVPANPRAATRDT